MGWMVDITPARKNCQKPLATLRRSVEAARRFCEASLTRGAFLSCRSNIGVAASFVAALLSVGCSLVSHTSGVPPSTGIPTPIHSNLLLHEALASSSSVYSRHPLDVLYPPPSPLPEQLSEAKPAGDDVVWAPGYWIWDTKEDNWHWIHGVWVHAPRGHSWTPGYWSIVGDGWRWVPGTWTIDPPPYSPSPDLASVSNGNWFANPGLGFYTGYGTWWGMYPYPYFYPVHHSGSAAPVVASPGPHAVEPVPFPPPPLASSIHNSAATADHLDMASIYASVPKPLASAFDQPERFELHTAHPLLALHPGVQSHAEHFSSLFALPHLTTLHDSLISHGDFAARSVSGAEAHGSSATGSGGHGGGGHGR